MSIFAKGKGNRLFFIFSMIIAKLTLLAVLVIAGFEIYVRWNLNQNFTFLGGSELEALTISSFALILGLNYINRAHKE